MNPQDRGRPSVGEASPAGAIPPSAAKARCATESLLRTCPNCGRELLERKCKLYCPEPRCGYFVSCADYY